MRRALLAGVAGLLLGATGAAASTGDSWTGGGSLTPNGVLVYRGVSHFGWSVQAFEHRRLSFTLRNDATGVSLAIVAKGRAVELPASKNVFAFESSNVRVFDETGSVICRGSATAGGNDDPFFPYFVVILHLPGCAPLPGTQYVALDSDPEHAGSVATINPQR